MTEMSRCPFCGQPLADKAAVGHLHRSERRFETKLRRELTEEANATAEGRAARKVARLEQGLKEERRKVGALEARQAKGQERVERRIRREVERERSARKRELERTVAQAQTRNEELRRRLDGLSAKERGELNEGDIFQLLVDAFPQDEITRTKEQGDIIEVVMYGDGEELKSAGAILYECKDTQRWSNAFIEQIRSDGRSRQTPYLLLVSRALPGGEKGMGVHDGVVIADAAHTIPMAQILRRMAIESHVAGLAGRDHAGKTEQLYEYLSSEEFREHLAAVVETGGRLDAMLQKERRAHERTWSQRHRIYAELGRESVAIEQAIHSIVEQEGPPGAGASRIRRAAGKRSPARRRRSAGSARSGAAR
jgi:hypothetical protein